MVFSILFYVSNEMMVPLVLSAVFFLLWAFTVAWVFPLQSRFENPVMVTIKNAVLCGLGQVPRSLVMAVLNLLLARSGRDEQAMMVTIAGLVVVLMMLVRQISDLFRLIKDLFQF